MNASTGLDKSSVSHTSKVRFTDVKRTFDVCETEHGCLCADPCMRTKGSDQ